MKDKVIKIIDGTEILSCASCHMDTINQKYCNQCRDIPSWRYTANPVQTMSNSYLDAVPSQSFVVASKTGTGKTQIAYDAIQHYYASGKTGKIIWINPLKQIVKEKVDEMSTIFPSKQILELTGDTSEDVGYGSKRNVAMKRADIIITSQEMFDSLTRKPDIYTATDQIGLIVIDEIHGLGDHNRGAKIDGALTRFLLRMKRFEKAPQIVALSATFDNVKDLKSYFDQFVNDTLIITSDFSPIRANVNPYVSVYSRDPIDLITDLVVRHKERAGGIMCMQLSIPGSKKLSERLNMMYGSEFSKVHFSELSREAKNQTIDQFNDGEFKVLCCTPTLLAGVNVACIVIILNLTFFNPNTMEMDVLPATAIRQAAGRVGRLPRFNEGWVEFIAEEKLVEKAQAILKSPNYIQGAIRTALSLILNIEISMQSQTSDILKEWYEHSFSGFSDQHADDNFDTTVQFLVEKGYCENINGTLISTKKGKSIAKNFVDPVFFENCVDVFNNEHNIVNTEELLDVMANLFTRASSPVPWTQGKLKHIQSQLNLDWLKRRGTRYYDWIIVQPKVQWAESLTFTMSRVQKVSEDLALKDMATKLKLLNFCVSNGMIPVPLARIGMRLESLGQYKLGSKYYFYLHCNGVTVDDTNVLNGPTEFKTPESATFYMARDRFVVDTWSSQAVRYQGVAAGLVKFYGKAPEVKESSDDQEASEESGDDDKLPWEV
jgi:replicative superfamily II helicase